MRLSSRDFIATVLVIVAGLVYVLWAIDTAPPGLESARTAGAVVLALGFAASASAVVPTFDALLHGGKAYLAVTSLIGAAALVGGLVTVISASGRGFALMTAALITLWLISTIHHQMLANEAATRTCPNCGLPAHRRYCDVCGYDLIEQTRTKVAHLPRG